MGKIIWCTIQQSLRLRTNIITLLIWMIDISYLISKWFKIKIYDSKRSQTWRKILKITFWNEEGQDHLVHDQKDHSNHDGQDYLVHDQKDHSDHHLKIIRILIWIILICYLIFRWSEIKLKDKKKWREFRRLTSLWSLAIQDLFLQNDLLIKIRNFFECCKNLDHRSLFVWVLAQHISAHFPRPLDCSIGMGKTMNPVI